jgi:anti-sigma regulatory factor (Ser/Thr protein kinase)
MDDVTAVFEPIVESVRDVRRFVARAIGGWDAVAAEDAALLASELATNAVIHAGTPYRVRVVHGRDTVRVEVADGSTATARRRHYSDTAGTGRGIGMVEDLAADWGIDVAADGKVVWFELRAGSNDGRTALAPGTAAHDEVEIDLDALLQQLGGWDDDTAAGDVPRLFAGSCR